MDFLKSLLTTYWDKFLILLAIIGFFGQWYFTLKSKKIETKYLLFQQNKIASVLKFYSCYTRTIGMWETFPIYRMCSNEYNPDDMDKMVTAPLNELRLCLYELSLFFEKKHLDLFQKAIQRITDINDITYQIYQRQIEGDVTKVVNKFTSVKEAAIAEAGVFMSAIGNKMRVDFKND